MKPYYFECYFDYGDEEKYDFCKKDYKEIHRINDRFTSNFTARFEASHFLNDKLSQYKQIHLIRGAVWKADDFVIKLHKYPDIFKLAIENQITTFERGVGCKLVDTWTNKESNEYFTISEYGGESIWDIYGEKAEEMIEEIEKKLALLGIIQKDSCSWNYVEKDGVIKVIDYESIKIIE